MEKFVKAPIDLSLWKKVSNIDRSEKWKWSWDTWDPVIEKLFANEAAITNINCPVCGNTSLYAFYVATRLKKPYEPLTFIGDRYFGCHICHIQKRDIGETPNWLEISEVYWATRNKKKEAEQELGKCLNAPIIYDPASR